MNRPTGRAVSRSASTALDGFMPGDLLNSLILEAKEAEPGKSGFALLSSGLDALCARAALIDGATSTIDIQYYLFHDDASGSWLAEKLLQAADRGVKVRVLIDDVNLLNRAVKIALVDLHPNIEVRRFNPFTTRHHQGILKWAELAFNFTRANRRMHNKSLVVDELATVFGGRNVGDEYFEVHSNLNFFDLDLLAVGPVVRDIRRSFDLYWNSRYVKPLSRVSRASAKLGMRVKKLRKYFRRFQKPLFSERFADRIAAWDFPARFKHGHIRMYWDTARIVADPPEKADEVTGGSPFLFEELRRSITAVESELRVVSPYFIPGNKGIGLIEDLRNRGIRLSVLTNSLGSNDLSLAHSGYCRYRVPVLNCGVELYELKRDLSDSPARRGLRRWFKWSFSGTTGASLHAKYFVFDRRQVFVGSFNLDPRSIFFNTEMGVFIECPDLAAQLLELIDDAVHSEAAYRLELDEPRRFLGFPLPRRIRWVDVHDGEVRAFDHDPGTGFFRRLLIILLTWLPVEKYL